MRKNPITPPLPHNGKETTILENTIRFASFFQERISSAVSLTIFVSDIRERILSTVSLTILLSDIGTNPMLPPSKLPFISSSKIPLPQLTYDLGPAPELNAIELIEEQYGAFFTTGSRARFQVRATRQEHR